MYSKRETHRVRPVSGGVRVCESRNAATTTRIPPDTSPNGNCRNSLRPFDYNELHKPLKPAENRGGLLEACVGGTVPLPRVLDSRTFERMRVDLGWCDICQTGKAVYLSR